MTPVTRFAPSPTGDLHIGGVRTALFCWLLARSQNGKFLLRIEDTDKEREQTDAIATIIESLKWLKLDWDGPILFQSQRIDFYQSYLEQLQREGKAYRCVCTFERLERMREAQRERGEKPKYDLRCRDRPFSEEEKSLPYVVRLKTSDQGTTAFHDAVHGQVTVNNSELDDLVLWRSKQGPTYNFCVVLDDWASGVTDVIRGDDHINNTPKQILISQALNLPIPRYAHLPLLLDEAGKKLSKRDGAASLLYYRGAGFLPEALLNYLARLGWSHKDQEIFSMDELKRYFSLSKVQKSPASINPSKLNWLNKKHLYQASPESLLAQLERLYPTVSWGQLSPAQGDYFALIKLFQERSTTLHELADYLKRFFGLDAMRPAKIDDEAKELIQAFIELIQSYKWQSVEELSDLLSEFKRLFSPKAQSSLRLALMGEVSTPPLHQLLWFLGKAETLKRLNHFSIKSGE